LDVEISKKCTPFWREVHVEVKTYKTLQCQTAFGRSGVEKVHAVVARSGFGALLEVAMFKTCTLLALLDVQGLFFVAGAMDSAFCQK